MSLELLASAPRQLPEALTLNIADHEYVVEQVHRWLPGRRLTARVRDGDGGLSLLKLFLGPGAQRYAERERVGLEVLANAGLRTPQILHRTSTAICLEYFVDAHSASGADVEAVADALAQLHLSGALHNDVHLDNFLISTAHGLVCVDGGSVRQTKVDPTRGVDELAVLLAQFPVGTQVLGAASDAYGKRFPQAQAALAGLSDALVEARKRRRQHYLKKALRDCTEFAVTRTLTQRRFCRRPQLALFSEFCRAPEQYFVELDSALKRGRSATVVRAKVLGQAVVIKRYNLKGIAHRLRRVFKPRARISWLNGLGLHFLGVPTAQPIGLLETGLRCWPSLAYVVLPDLGDESLAVLTEDADISDHWLQSLAALEQTLVEARVVHGDFKATNFIAHHEKLHLIDVDAIQWDTSERDVDRRRLLANWREGMAVHQKVSALLN